MKTFGHLNTVTKGLISLAVLGVLAVTLNSVVFSGAAFTATSSNPGNLFSAGTLSHVNDKDGGVVLDAAGLTSGAVRSGEMTLHGTGDVGGAYTLSAGSPASGAALAAALTLTVDEIDEAGTTMSTLYEGSLAGLAAAPIDLGSLNPGQDRAYRFTLAYPASNASPSLSGMATSLEIIIEGVSQ